MSIDSARDFIKRMESDQKFAIKIREFHNLEEIIAYATKIGFDFTNKELSFLKDQLSDDDLELVVGGVSGWKDDTEVTGGIKS